VLVVKTILWPLARAGLVEDITQDTPELSTNYSDKSCQKRIEKAAITGGEGES